MTSLFAGNLRVLAVDPTSKGFGFAVFEGPEYLIDWGLKHGKGDLNRGCIRRVEEFIAQYDPDVLVLEDTVAKGSRRCDRVRKLAGDLHGLALGHKIPLRKISRRQVKRLFSAVANGTKRDIAVAIAQRFPELDTRVPPVRKPWMSEDERMAIFDATSLALTFFASADRRKQA